MESDKAVNGDVGLQIVLEGKKTLTIGKEELVLHDAVAKKANRGACAPSSSGTEGPIPLYDILWVEVANGKLTIDSAAHPSQTIIKHETRSFAILAGESQSEVSPEGFASALLARAYGDAQRQKRAYVLINPHAGPGGALRRWNAEVKPLFDAARMKLDVVVLSRGGEATELAEKVDIDKYDTIMACSGDGTPHEIFNGLARRPDAAKALSKVAVSHIPCGSGNAMACNLYGSHRPAFAALGIIKGVVTPMDLVSVTQGSNRIISFLSQSLGIVAESDLGTEHLRWMGSKRFEVGLMMRVFQRRCYPCDLAVKVEIEEKGDVRAHYKKHASETNLSKPAVNGTNGTYEGDGLPPLKYGTVQDDLPAGWELVPYDKIGNFYCGNMAYMAPNAHFFSAAMVSDGCMDLVTVNGDLSPILAAKTLMAVESDKFFDMPHVSYKKISAYRIIPRDQEDGYISIDGERIPFAPFQAEVHHALGRVISKRGVYEAAGPADWDKVSLAERIHA